MYFFNVSALWALLGLVGFLAVYFFKRRAKNIKVSTLMFFHAKGVPEEGGIRLANLQTPWILLLELLIVTFLILSVAAPAFISKSSQIPLVLILDDSYSMTARADTDGKTALERATAYLENNILSQKYYKLNLILAGSYPEIMGKYDMDVTEAKLYMKGWQGKANTSDISAAIRLANESFDKGVKFLVFTDAKNEIEQQTQNETILWLAFGKPVDNLAITAANRYSLASVDRCFFEFTNLSSTKTDLSVLITEQGTDRVIEKINEKLPANGQRRLILNFDNQEATLCAQIISKDFTLDNYICLPPTKRPLVKVRIKTSDKNLENLLLYTIQAVGLAKIVKTGGDVLITDLYESGLENLWQFVICKTANIAMLDGVVNLDKGHPLCMGMPPVKGIWAIATDAEIEGKPLIVSKEIPLLSLKENKTNAKEIFLNLDYTRSTITLTPFWPVLFYNLFEWYQNELVGNKSLAKGFSKVESSFIALNTGELPDKILSEKEMRYFVIIRWWFILLALLLILLHHWLMGRRA